MLSRVVGMLELLALNLKVSGTKIFSCSNAGQLTDLVIFNNYHRLPCVLFESQDLVLYRPRSMKHGRSLQSRLFITTSTASSLYSPAYRQLQRRRVFDDSQHDGKRHRPPFVRSVSLFT
jgi:hypothetical protein